MGIIEKLAQDFCKGKYDHKVEDSIWPLVFEHLCKNDNVLDFDVEKIHTLWTVNGGHLRRKVSNDDLILSVLLRALPNYTGEGLILYRGECKFLYNENKIGFCWTPSKVVARKFARGLNAAESGGVLLKVCAESKAIISSPNDHSAKTMNEFEYTCNPRLLHNIQVIESFYQVSEID